MPDIRYVCLSDLHLGAESSLLSCLAGVGGVNLRKPSPSMVGLVDCLGALIAKNEDQSTKPTLVLLGDILELALSIENVPAMVFEHFIDLAFPDGARLFADTIYFVPGNHDHHLWEGARERQYADYILNGEQPGNDLKAPWHTTRMLGLTDPDPIDTVFLNALVRRKPGREDMCVRAVYPNLAIPSDDGRRWAVIHHGHFVESLYRSMSVVRDLVFAGRMPPTEVWDWEAENFAWIDFLWSALGRSGEVGESLGVGYDSLKSEKAMDRLVANLATGLAVKRHPSPGPRRLVESRLFRLVLQRLVKKIAAQERRDPTAALSARAETGLQLYLEGPLLSQILREVTDRNPPEEVTFVFGHTHKPFTTRHERAGYGRPIDIYNTGGWVVDTPRPTPMQGAAAILLDENLDAASLRLFNQTTDGGPTRVHVERADTDAPDGNPFYTRLAAMVDPETQPWSGFSTAVAEAVVQRRRRLCDTLADLERPPGEQPAWT